MLRTAGWVRFALLSTFALVLSANLVFAGDAPSRAGLGQKVEGVEFMAKGKVQPLQELKGKAGTVVVFLSFDCPISTNYSEALAQLARTFEPKGIAFIGVVTSDDEDAASVA